LINSRSAERDWNGVRAHQHQGQSWKKKWHCAKQETPHPIFLLLLEPIFRYDILPAKVNIELQLQPLPCYMSGYCPKLPRFLTTPYTLFVFMRFWCSCIPVGCCLQVGGHAGFLDEPQVLQAAFSSAGSARGCRRRGLKQGCSVSFCEIEKKRQRHAEE
jgi:hypothetical protein